MAALLEKREQVVLDVKVLDEDDWGLGATWEDAPFWGLRSRGLSGEEGRVEDCRGWFRFWFG